MNKGSKLCRKFDLLFKKYFTLLMIRAKGRQLTDLSDTETTMSFKYDCNGIRTKKTVNGVETKYTYVGSMLVSQKTSDEVINFAYTAGGAPYGFTYDGQNYFYLLSLQGDIIGIYDSTGTVVVRYTYDAWGKLISITGQLANTVGVKNPLRYRGYYYDTEIGLYYLQSRYYDPETCHFINRDSYFIAGNDHIQGANMFSYCYNNPVMYSDPTGNVTGGYSSPSEQVAINVSTIVACLVYIVDYAEKNGKNYYAVVDFLNRTTKEKSKLVNYAEVLTVGVYILAGEDWLSMLLSTKGIYGDVKNVVKTALGGTVKSGAVSGVISAATNIFMDFYNPLMFDDDVRLNAPIHIASAAAGVGIGMFTVELVAAVTGLTGNPWVGAAVGTLFVGIVAFSEI